MMSRYMRLLSAALGLFLFSSIAFAQGTLPDFTVLVDRVSPAVVNIEAEMRSDTQLTQQAADPQVQEFFRRFFGQDMPPQPTPQPQPRGQTSFGSGFMISADGYIITNHHVVAGANNIIVRFSDRRELSANLVGSDQASDIALLKVDGAGLPFLRLGNSDELKAGQWVIAIGSPFGYEYSVTAGVVSGTGRRSMDPSQRYVPFIQTDVAINRGNSGGPLLSSDGDVVGVNSQIFSITGAYMGLSFAIPIETAMNVVSQLKADGKVRRGVLGVNISEVSRERAVELKLPVASGAHVTSVNNESAAARAGILPGDVITEFNGKPVVRASDLPPLVGSLAPGQKATVGLMRSGRKVKLAVTLDALDEAVASAASARPESAQTIQPDPLGLEMEALSSAERRQLRLASGEGMRIKAINSAISARAGLSAGDILLSVNGRPVGSATDYRSAISALKSGSVARLLIRSTVSTGFVLVPIP